MSYILNALKRSEQARRANEDASLPARLAVTAGAAPARRRFRWKWIGVGGGAVALAAVGTLAVFDRGAGPDATPARGDAVETALAVPQVREPHAGAAPAGGGAPPPAAPGDPPRPPAVVAALPSPPLAADAAPYAAPTPPTVTAPDRPRASPRLLAGVRIAASGAVRPAEPKASFEAPERLAPAGLALVPVPSLPLLADAIPRPPAGRRTAAAAPAPEPPPATSPAEQAEPQAAALAVPAADGPVVAPPLPPVTTDREAIRAAAQLNELGWSHERDGQYESAVHAFTRALDARPDYAEAYFGRAWAHERLDRLDQAIEDYGWAIRLKPDFAAAHNTLGIALLYRGRLEDAARHFAAAYDLGDGELKRYAMLWRFAATARAGGDGRRQLEADARAVDIGRWPGVLARLFLGEATSQDVLAEADTGDAITRRERLCVAYFFLGQQALLRGDRSQAKAFFRDALETGVTAFAQYTAAERELLRLAAVRE